MTQTTVKPPNIPVGISSCLMGDEVRFNGGHCHSSLCTQHFSSVFNYQKFCPEVAAGLGIPRPVLRLVGDPNTPALVFTDHQDQILNKSFKQASAAWLDQCAEWDGYILMKNSPSCGMERVKVYAESGQPLAQKGRGIFTAELMKRYPLLPVEEEGRLNDPRLRENFILRVFAHHYFRYEVLANMNPHALLQFHSRYKYITLAHNQEGYRRLGKMLSNAGNEDIHTLAQRYFYDFMHILAKPASRKNHANTLLHLLGYLKRDISGKARQDLANVIENYRKGAVNLATPLTMIRHYLNQFGSDYVRSQRYLEPYPSELGLPNWV